MSDQKAAQGLGTEMLFDHLEKCWLPGICWHGGAHLDRFVERVHDENHEGHGEDSRRYRVYTRAHVYTIVAVVKEGGGTYLGCTARARKPRPGEDHTRGNDLPDGKFEHETWLGIVRAIVGYELVKLEPKHEAKEVVEVVEDI